MTPGTALMFPTWWNALASAVVTAAYGLKTRYEDSYLAANLAGYLPYRRRVRFRLIPGLW